LGDVNVAVLDQSPHLAEDEGEKEGADVGAIHVRVGHDDDLVVAGLGGVEGPFPLVIADAGAGGGDDGPDLLV
jgi:hypothetical protein